MKTRQTSNDTAQVMYDLTDYDALMMRRARH
jgi:hypothetical protein